jgi:methylmalonyl-CoA/ethylmalonyl-CoA epimerase
MKQPLDPKTVCQIAIVVRDMEKTLDQYVKAFGLETRPTPMLTGPYEESHAVYRGQPMKDARAKLAFIPMGQVQLEIIEPLEGASIWMEHLEKHGDGIHHVAFFVPDMDKTVANLEACGLPEVQKGDYPGGCYSYIDAEKSLGFLIELLANK